MRLAYVFTDHMVLQRGKQIAVWGETDEENVRAKITEDGGNELCIARAATSDGKFCVCLPPMEAGGPYELTVSDGREKIKFSDVMIGEVWLAGGQSNMELELSNSAEGEEELSKIEGENVRYYYVPKEPWENDELKKKEEESTWERPDAEASKKWSAVAFHFAKNVSRKLGVTVGIIGCNWGGTSASCWISRHKQLESQKTDSYVREYDEIVEHQDMDEYLREREHYLAYQAEFDKNVSNYYATHENPTWDEALELFGENLYPGPVGPYNEHRPAGLYEVLLKKVCPYSLRGFLYYQGEEDDRKPDTYYELLRALIEQWREDWEDDSLPFLIVQLPGFANVGEKDFKNWPLIRDAQMRAYETVKNTGIAITIECGEYGNIHPTKKETVGKRLALQALCHVYHQIGEGEAAGPMYDSCYVAGNCLMIKIKNCPGGLIERNNVGGFEIAGADKVYRRANYQMMGDGLISVSSPAVSAPKYARYLWCNYQEVGIFGRNGIPLAPFRTSRGDGSKASFDEEK
ncbi:MAG: sialate O-acetylesterase [Clostridiales bacterium]|nr:sialate O-acetylesterase [Clostridiales bacterium]